MQSKRPTSGALLSRVPIHPLLFAAYAVLYLYSVNLDAVLPVDAGAPLGRSLLGAAALLIVFGLLFRDSRRGAVVASALVIAFFAYGYVAKLVTGIAPKDDVQLVGWSVVVIGALVYAIRARASLPQVTMGLNVIAVILVALTAWQIVPYELQRAGRIAPFVDQTAVAATNARKKPDIYFLIFDRYGSADAIKRRFGITDDDLYGWLQSRGFQIPKVARGNYRATDFSLAATLNMRMLDELTTTIGAASKDRTPAQQMLKNHEVGRFLKAQGYTYYHLGSWFEPTRTNPEADRNLTLGVTSEFESVLWDTTIAPGVERAIGVQSPEVTFRDRVREGTLMELRELRRVSTAPGPKFVFAHILLPHDPYVFHADGSVLTADEEKAADERDLYAGHLAFANSKIKEIVEYLQAGPAEDRPVVIIQGDEGPLGCQNVDCVKATPDYYAIRFGVLNAMYLPGVDVTLPDVFTSVNTFRLVFREYFGADLPPLPDRSFTWPDNDHLYDFQDVTDQIPAPD